MTHAISTFYFHFQFCHSDSLITSLDSGILDRMVLRLDAFQIMTQWSVHSFATYLIPSEAFDSSRMISMIYPLAHDSKTCLYTIAIAPIITD